MALNRNVHFTSESPTKDEVESVTRNFFGEAATVTWNKDTLTVRLVGAATWAFEGIEPDLMPNIRNPERWIEVIPGNPLEVTTRRADEYTNVCAKALAELLALNWTGKVDHGE